MGMLRSIFPPVNSVSFYSILCKILAMVAYIVLLMLLFGLFINSSNSEQRERLSGEEDNNTESYPLQSKDLSVNKQIIITRGDLNEARKGPNEAAAIVNIKGKEIGEALPDIIFKE